MKTGKSLGDKREPFFDLLKGFTILLVVLGHCIQEGSGASFSAQSLYFQDRLYQFIYSFHMPLFMMVSGYLSWGSIEKAVSGKERVALIKRRAKVLLTPVFFWTGVEYLRNFMLNPSEEAAKGPVKILISYFYNALSNLWFLWAVFWCFLIVFVMHCYLKDNIILYILGFLLMFFVPDGMCLGVYKYMLPYFILSFYACGWFRKNGERVKKFAAEKRLKIWALPTVGVIFAILFFFYDDSSFIYLTGYKLIGKNVPQQFGIDAYRTLIGFAGSIFFILLWKLLMQKFPSACKVLTLWGRDTMGIYIISGYLTLFVVKELTFSCSPSYLLNLAETAILFPAAWGLTRLMGRIPFVRRTIGKSG